MEAVSEARAPQWRLSWAIHESFLAYVEQQVPDAEISCSGGAYRDADGGFCFPQELGGSSGELRFRGAVHFTGHGGMLDMRIEDPRIELRGSTRALSVVDAVDEISRIDFAEVIAVPRAAGDEEPAVFDARINAFSSQEMGGVYPPGSDMARIVVSRRG